MTPFTLLPIIVLILYAAMCGLGRLAYDENKDREQAKEGQTSGFRLFTYAFYGILWLWAVGCLALGSFLCALMLLKGMLHLPAAKMAELNKGLELLKPFSLAMLSIGVLSVSLMFKQVRLWLNRCLPFSMASPLHHFGLIAVLPAIAVFISSTLMVTPADLIKMMKSLNMLVASLVNTSYFLGFSLIGIGWGYARNTKQSMERLGFRAITPKEAALAVGVAFGMFIFLSFILDPVLRLFLPTDTAFQETIMQLTKPGKTTGNVPLEILLVSLMAGVGEEFFFRGLLMPIVGLIPSAILFALIHLQYGVSSGFVIVLCSGLLLGWLKKRYGTTASIITHTVYDILALSAVSYLMKPH